MPNFYWSSRPIARHAESIFASETTRRAVLSPPCRRWALQYLMLYGHLDAELWLLEYADRGTHWNLAIQYVLEVRGEAGWPLVEPILRRRVEENQDADLYERWAWLIAAVDPWEDRFGSIPRFANVFKADWEQGDCRSRFGEGPSPASVREYLFEPDDQSPSYEWFKSLPTTVTHDDLAALEEALQGDYRQMQKAFRLLKRIDRMDMVWVACLHHLSQTELALDGRQSIAIDFFARDLPGRLVLPTAREWQHSPIVHQRQFAEEALSHHADDGDRPALLERVQRSLEPFRERSLVNLIKALRLTGNGPLCELEPVFELATGSFLREIAAETLAASDQKRFEQTFAFECLWDSGEGVRDIGKVTVNPNCPRANRRIQRLRKRPEPDLLI